MKLRELPPVSRHPGVGNINRPGVAPDHDSSRTPNINRPGRTRSRRGFSASDLSHQDSNHDYSYRGSHNRHRSSYSRRGSYGSSFVFYYGIPYALPYYEPYGYMSYYDVYSGGGYYSAPPPPQPLGPYAPGDPAAGPLTLLAFQDQTILAVVDYWLEGDILYYQTRYGLQGSIPLDRLDLALTQQLNLERNIPFVLEPPC